MPTWVFQAIQLLGIGGFVTVIFALAAWLLAKAWAAWISANASRIHADASRLNADTKKDEAVTGFAVRFDDERRLWEERHHNLQKEFTDFRIEQARKEGGLDVLKEMLGQERDKLQKLEVRVQELEKRIKSDETRIYELETERDDLLKRVDELKATILLGDEAQRDLKTQLEQQINRADSLNNLVTQLQEIDNSSANKTQDAPEKVWDEESEQTLIVPPKLEATQAIPDITATTTSAATEAAEETKS